MPERFASAYAGMTVAVTGAGGYVGGALTAALVQAGATVVRQSRRPLPPRPGCLDIQAEITDPLLWSELTSRAATIFHLAGETSTYAAEKDPAASLAANVIPVLHLIQAARQQPTPPTVIVAGTVTQVGMPHHLPVDENVIDQPVTCYDLQKLTAERHLKLAASQGILRGACLRLANVYGPSPNANGAADRGILNKVVRAALAGNPVTIYGDGGHVRDYIHIDDVVAAFLAAGRRPEAVNGRHLLVATGQGTTLGEAFTLAAQLAGAVAGRQPVLRHAPWPDGMSPIEFRHFVGDPRALAAATGWQPRIGLAAGLRMTVNAFANEMSA